MSWESEVFHDWQTGIKGKMRELLVDSKQVIVVEAIKLKASGVKR